MRCRQLNEQDLVEYLEQLGYQPQRVRGNDYWYLSPLREEKTASFKVNRQLNVWYDHGTGKGGRLVDFGILYFNCTVAELLNKAGVTSREKRPAQPPALSRADEKKQTAAAASKIKVISAREITDPGLRHFLSHRQIPLSVANQFCDEVVFELYDKKHLAIGFKNERGGYELRNSYFKGSSTPKQPRLIGGKEEKELAVFEGFFSFLSFQTVLQSRGKLSMELPAIKAHYLVLNSLAFFEKNRGQMERYETVHLFLDRDKMGLQSTAKALSWSDKYKDQSRYYQQHKDLNEWLVQSLQQELQKERRRGRHL